MRPKLRRAWITRSYDLNTIEEAFDVVLKLDLAFKSIVNVKAQYFKCEGYGHHDYYCPLESQHIRTVPIDDVDDSNVSEDVHVSVVKGAVMRAPEARGKTRRMRVPRSTCEARSEREAQRSVRLVCALRSLRLVCASCKAQGTPEAHLGAPSI